MSSETSGLVHAPLFDGLDLLLLFSFAVDFWILLGALDL